MDAPKYTCPECGSLILNRTYPKCERCHADLPVGLLFSKAEADQQWDTLMSTQRQENDEKHRDTLHLKGIGGNIGMF
jgi:ribosomal protein L37AE/L43A